MFAKKEKPAETKAEVNYDEMSLKEKLDELDKCVDALCKSATKSEIQKCKKIRESLGKVTGLDENATVYFNAVTMSVDMLFQNEMPAVVNMMIKNTSSTLKMQINNLRNTIQ